MQHVCEKTVTHCHKAENYREIVSDLLTAYKTMGYVPKSTFLRLSFRLLP
jgi:hypothetical protein